MIDGVLGVRGLIREHVVIGLYTKLLRNEHEKGGVVVMKDGNIVVCQCYLATPVLTDIKYLAVVVSHLPKLIVMTLLALNLSKHISALEDTSSNKF